MYHRFMHHNSILLQEDREDSQILSFKKIFFFFHPCFFPKKLELIQAGQIDQFQNSIFYFSNCWKCTGIFK